jgi:hypothetical protein
VFDHRSQPAYDPERLNKPDIMSHDDFILGYQNGRLGCSVSGLLTFRLFFAGRIREKRVVTNLICWSLGLVLLLGLSTMAFLYLPVFWASLATIITLAVFAVGSIHQIAELVVSAALADQQFYELARAERALWVSADGESNLPKLQKVVPMRHPRRAQR